LNATKSEDVEIIIVNDGLDRATSELAHQYPVKVINGNGNGPAAARNIGVQSSSGEMLIFLDADCRVSSEWLESHLEAHKRYDGLLAVGGSICLEPDAPFWARCDHYCAWYNVNPFLPASWVPNHTPANLSIKRTTFKRVGPFQEDLPRAGVHEEAMWQGRLLRLGGHIRFEPRAAVWHTDRDDLKGYLRHNYWWAYNSITVKSQTGISRFPWVYKRPWMLVAGSIPFAVAHTMCKLEPLILSPILFAGRLAYTTGMFIGRIRSTKGNRKR
jgi:GT2 family glycosyltransferase